MRALPIVETTSRNVVKIARPFLKLRHRQRFQTKISQVFEQFLLGDTRVTV